jgi:hypothetical protein
MMRLMKSSGILVVVMLGLLWLHYCGQPASDNAHSFQFNSEFGFTIYCRYDSAPDMEQELMKVNNALLKVIQLQDDKDIRPTMSVACFTQERAISLDSAFFGQTAKHRPDIANLDIVHEIKEAAKYTHEYKSFYRKTTLLNGEQFSVMMYFMENDSSNRMYELKLAGDVSDSSDMKNMLLTIAHTVAFKR